MKEFLFKKSVIDGANGRMGYSRQDGICVALDLSKHHQNMGGAVKLYPILPDGEMTFTCFLSMPKNESIPVCAAIMDVEAHNLLLFVAMQKRMPVEVNTSVIPRRYRETGELIISRISNTHCLVTDPQSGEGWDIHFSNIKIKQP